MKMSSTPLMLDQDDVEGGQIKSKGDQQYRRQGLLFDNVDTFVSNNCVAAANVSIRMGFLRKVFGILAIQITVTTFVAAFVMMYPGAKPFVQGWSWLMTVGLIASFVLLFAMLIKRHETPLNYILLAAWTVVEAYTVATVVTYYDVDVVVTALFITAVVTIGLFAYALQTKHDYSACSAGLFVAVLVLITGSMLQMVLMSPMMDFMLSLAGAGIFSVYIVVDVHLMLHQLSPEEYILATINLYLDILNLFLNILRLLQHVNRQ